MSDITSTTRAGIHGRLSVIDSICDLFNFADASLLSEYHPTGSGTLAFAADARAYHGKAETLLNRLKVGVIPGDLEDVTEIGCLTEDNQAIEDLRCASVLILKNVLLVLDGVISGENELCDVWTEELSSDLQQRLLEIEEKLKRIKPLVINSGSDSSKEPALSYAEDVYLVANAISSKLMHRQRDTASSEAESQLSSRFRDHEDISEPIGLVEKPEISDGKRPLTGKHKDQTFALMGSKLPRFQEKPYDSLEDISIDRITIIADHILSQLAFSSMKERLEEVATAHHKTFEWIFQDRVESIKTCQPQETSGIPKSELSSQRALAEAQEKATEISQPSLQPVLDEKSISINLTNPVPRAAERKLSDEGNHFPTWLSRVLDYQSASDQERNIYWINGKAGSGKSTLMRYIYSHHKTAKLLRKWTRGSKLASNISTESNKVQTAGFFFWTSGSQEQRSQTGLLRSLLHQLLQDHVELVPKVFPEIWKKVAVLSTKERIKMHFSWSLEELKESFQQCLAAISQERKICLFIDGLDEFDGDHGEIIGFLNKITSNPGLNTKICLSSRPWPIFEAAFSKGPTLKVQDLTNGDMFQYVKDKFSQSAIARITLTREPVAGEVLMNDIVQKADGVFLWIILVIRSLLSSTWLEDSVVDIQSRLNILPADLDELFRHTLFDIQEASHVAEASRIFQIIRAREIVCEFTNDESAPPITLWELSLTHQDLSHIALATDSHIRQYARGEITGLCKKTEAAIDNRCAGLLEIHEKKSSESRGPRFVGEEESEEENKLAHSKITYLHRTIRDWLLYSKPDVWNEVLEKTVGSGFCPHRSHLRSQVLKLKCPITEPKKHRRFDDLWPGIVLALTHARYIEPSSNNKDHEDVICLIREFDRAVSSYWASRGAGDHWARSAFGSYEERNKNVVHAPFLSLCVKFGLVDYVQAELEASPIEHNGGQPLLSQALSFLVSRQQSLYPFSTLPMIEMLLKKGEDPNFTHALFSGKSSTPWPGAIALVRQAQRRGWISAFDTAPEGTERWVAILFKLVEYGALPDAVIEKTRWDAEVDTLAVVKAAVERFRDVRVHELWKAMRDWKGKKSIGGL